MLEVSVMSHESQHLISVGCAIAGTKSLQQVPCFTGCFYITVSGCIFKSCQWKINFHH